MSAAGRRSCEGGAPSGSRREHHASQAVDPCMRGAAVRPSVAPALAKTLARAPRLAVVAVRLGHAALVRRSRRTAPSARSRKARFVSALVLVCALGSVSTIVSGCPSPVDEATATLEKAIRDLSDESRSWQGVLERTRDELIRQGRSTLVNEVANVLSGATADAAIEARCTADFLRHRVENDLRRLLAKHKGTPLICCRFSAIQPPPRSISTCRSTERTGD